MDQKNMQSTFMTQFKQPRPKTSYISRNKSIVREQLVFDPQVNPIIKIKNYKEELKKLESDYQHALTRLNQSKKMVDTNYRNSQKKKNRKMKLIEQKLLEEKQQTEEKDKIKLRERAKTMKLNTEIRGLLLKNQQDEANADTCNKNKQEKQNIRHKLSINKQKDLQRSRNNFMRIKNQQMQLQNRRKRIAEVQSIISKQNYIKKLGSQMHFIETYDKILNQICEDGSICEGRTSDTKTFFITQKKGTTAEH